MFATTTCLALIAEDGAFARRLPGEAGFVLIFDRHQQLVPVATFERFIGLGFVQADGEGLFRITPAGRVQTRYAR